MAASLTILDATFVNASVTWPQDLPDASEGLVVACDCLVQPDPRSLVPHCPPRWGCDGR
jgi:hypothetical protein